MSTDASVPQPKRGMSTALIVILILVGAMIFMCLLLPAVQTARSTRRSPCTNQLKLIGIALQNYHDTYKEFPPAYLADADGKPMHSWRVLILPFMEDAEPQAVYKAYDFSEPWNGPKNRQLAARAAQAFRCPSDPTSGEETNYLAVVGPETGWPGATSMNIRKNSDGTSNTIAVIETAESGIHWMEPRDATFADAAVRAGSHHAGGYHTLFFDGSVHFFDQDTSPAVLDDLLTARGGEARDLPD